MLQLKGKADLSVLKNPFASNLVDGVSLFYRKHLFSGKAYWTGTVSFKNGNTSGEQKFENEDFETTVRQINGFISSLGT